MCERHDECVREKKCEELLYCLMTPVGESFQTALECHFCLMGAFGDSVSSFFTAYDLEGGAIYHTSTMHACMQPRKVDKSLQACYGGRMGKETSQWYSYYFLGYSQRIC